MAVKSRRLAGLGYATYSDYLRSAHWLNTRARFLSQRRRCCEACNQANVVLHVHHQTYAELGRESMTDLTLLCEDCHTEVHALANLLADRISLREATLIVIKEGQGKPNDSPDPKEVIEMRQRKSARDGLVPPKKRRKRKNRANKRKSRPMQSWRAD